jgi:hypothetical protein
MTTRFRSVAKVTDCKGAQGMKTDLAPIWDNEQMEITLPELERAINYWRNTHPATGEEARLCREASLLATPYAMLIFTRRPGVDHTELDADTLAAYEGSR